jgi:hypothetical protein
VFRIVWYHTIEVVYFCGTYSKIGRIWTPAIRDPEFYPRFLFFLLLFCFFCYFFLYWALVANASGSTAACRLIVRARLWKFPLVPPGAPHAFNDVKDL